MDSKKASGEVDVGISQPSTSETWKRPINEKRMPQKQVKRVKVGKGKKNTKGA